MWRASLREKKDRRVGPTIDEIDFIDSIRSSRNPFPDDWSEERKLEFARQFFAEMPLIDAFLDEHYQIYDFSVDMAGATARRTAFFFLTDPSLAFDLSLDQRKSLLRVMEGTTFSEPVEDFFVDLGYSNARGSGGLFIRREAAVMGASARDVFVAAEAGSTRNDWLSTLTALGGLSIAMSFSQLGLTPPAATPPNPAHPGGWVPNTPIIPKAPKAKVTTQGTSTTSTTTVRTVTTNSGRGVRLSSPKAKFVSGDLQNPNIAGMVNTNGRWVLAQPTVLKPKPAGFHSRINIANGPTRFSRTNNAGFRHIEVRHFNPGRNAGQFTISQSRLREILSDPNTVRTPVREIPGNQFERIINVGEYIGTIKPSIPDVGGQPTTYMRIITDRAGNLITTYPIPKPLSR